MGREGRRMSTGVVDPRAQPAHRYLAQVVAADGRVVRTERLAAATDDEALALAAALSGSHAVALWDGLRFLEHFDPRATPDLFAAGLLPPGLLPLDLLPPAKAGDGPPLRRPVRDGR
jgi:hypothetical protein